MIRHYYWPTPNGHKTAIMLEEVGIEYEVFPVDILNGEQFDPEFIRISPNNRIPAIVDTDLGQSDIGPPTSIGFSIISEPVADLFSAKPATIVIMGRTSSKGITQRVVSSLTSIMKQISERAVDLTVINTDGWIEGDEARTYKTELIRKISPNLVIGIQRNAELEHILHSVEEKGCYVLRTVTSSAIKRRNRQERGQI